VADVLLMMDHHTNRPKGFGFIEFASTDLVEVML